MGTHYTQVGFLQGATFPSVLIGPLWGFRQQEGLFRVGGLGFSVVACPWD